MGDEFHAPDRTWRKKFLDAFRGCREGMRDQTSFYVHIPCAIGVVVAAIVVRLPLDHWAILALCITLVLAGEMFNTALEHLAKAIDRSHNPHIGNALDIGSAAVLICSLGAVVVGILVFLDHIIGCWAL